MKVYIGIVAAIAGSIYGIVGMFWGAAYLGSGHGTGIFYLMFAGVYYLGLILWPICSVAASLVPRSSFLHVLQLAVLAHYATVGYGAFLDPYLSRAFSGSPPIGILSFFACGQAYIWWPRKNAIDHYF